jgi:hypothetical protein
MEFTSLSAKTRKSYGQYLRNIEDEFGDMPAITKLNAAYAE